VSAKGRARILGPYEERAGWRLIVIDAFGTRAPRVFPTEAKARRYKEVFEAELARETHTTETALEAYRRHLADVGHKPQSVRAVEWSIVMLLSEPIELALLTQKRCQALYDTLRTQPNKYTKKPPAVDTHRNSLMRSKVFLHWCVSKGWLRENPLEGVKGMGRRRPRGKSLGKSGNELRIKQAREWYAKALELASRGDVGAVAGLVAMLLGMRASEIVSRLVRDLDDEEARGDVLWISCSKTAAGRRTLEVPEVLRALLVAQADGKAPERYLFERKGSKKAEAVESKPHRPQWIIRQVHRICDLAKVPRVTAHSMRGLLATLTAERGMSAHLIAATLGHASTGVTLTNYAAPGSATQGALRRGWQVLNGGVQVEAKSAK
jgi:integrase